MKADNIQIVEKPDWVSWDEIKACMTAAHELNVDRGIVMSHQQQSAEDIKDYVDGKGVFYVALSGAKVVGTACLRERKAQYWFVDGPWAYFCYASILPEYAGLGIYGKLCTIREQKAKELGYKVCVAETHEHNFHVQKLALKNGYRFVDYNYINGHCRIFFAKWIDKCPFSERYCNYRFKISKLKTRVVKLFK